MAEAGALPLGEYLRLGARNLRLSPLRTGLTLVTMALGLGTLTLLSALNDGWLAAMQDAGLTREDLDASVIAAVPEYHKQRSVAGVVQEYLNLNPKPTWLTEVACASGSAALRTAWMAINAGMHEIVAVIGCQKMTELSTPEILALMGRVGEVQWESVFGTTFPGYYAMFATRHMHEFGTTKEMLASVAVKNHHNGTLAPKSMLKREITVDEVMQDVSLAVVRQQAPLQDPAKVAPKAFEELLAELVDDRQLDQRGEWIARVDFHPQPTQMQEQLLKNLEKVYRDAGVEAKGRVDMLALAKTPANQVDSLLSYLFANGTLVRLNDDSFMHKEAYQKAITELKHHFAVKETLTLAEFRDRIGSARKQTQAILELFDSQKYTMRKGDERVAWQLPE